MCMPHSTHTHTGRINTTIKTCSFVCNSINLFAAVSHYICFVYDSIPGGVEDLSAFYFIDNRHFIYRQTLYLLCAISDCSETIFIVTSTYGCDNGTHTVHCFDKTLAD